jgi:phage FluMu gp28-like protein
MFCRRLAVPICDVTLPHEEEVLEGLAESKRTNVLPVLGKVRKLQQEASRHALVVTLDCAVDI